MLERSGLRSVERVLTACLVVLKLYVLRLAWGHMQGFDALPWLEVFRLTHWFKPLPAAASTFGSYHPPLSYLLCRWIYDAYPHELEASQILSALAMLGAVFAVRDTLRTIGVLFTVPGLMMLYTTASIPLVVWMQTETTYDALVFTWVMAALALSVRLFWAPTPARGWRRPGRLVQLLCLGGVLGAGLLTKFNTAVAFALPFLVMAVRRGPRQLRAGEIGGAVVACAIGVIIAAPLWYQRYYLPLHQLFPQPMEWLRAEDLKRAIALRDADRRAFFLHMLRIPTEPLTRTQEPVTDSFIHSVWLQIWKRDIVLGPQPSASMAVSDGYLRVFAPIVLASTAWFLARHRRMPGPWRDLGYVLLAMSAAYSVLLVYFAYKYPIWDWRVFKAKYVTPAMLWISYCVVVPVLVRPNGSDPPWRPRGRVLRDAVTLVAVVWCLLPILFMIVNHLVPVY
jgi:hypothetical protein